MIQSLGSISTQQNEKSTQIMDYVDAAMTGTISPHILPITDLRQMISHIEETLDSTMNLPVSSEDTLHFYRYLHPHVLIVNQQFLLLIDVPLQEHTQQLSIYKILLSISLMEISQHDIISVLHILELHRMKLWQYKFHNTSSAYVKQQMDSFVTFIHHFTTCQLSILDHSLIHQEHC